MSKKMMELCETAVHDELLDYLMRDEIVELRGLRDRLLEYKEELGILKRRYESINGCEANRAYVLVADLVESVERDAGRVMELKRVAERRKRVTEKVTDKVTDKVKDVPRVIE